MNKTNQSPVSHETYIPMGKTDRAGLCVVVVWCLPHTPKALGPISSIAESDRKTYTSVTWQQVLPQVIKQSNGKDWRNLGAASLVEGQCEWVGLQTSWGKSF